MLASAHRACRRCSTTPAHVLIVFDPSNYAQNVLTAARSLEQITNQITSLQNQAQMLINQATHLASLPFSALQQLAAERPAHSAASSARRRASPSTSSKSTRCSSRSTGSASMSATDQQLITDARSRWQNTVGGLQDAMRVQSRRREQYRHQPHADVGAGQPEPVGDRCVAGDASRQPASALLAQQLARSYRCWALPTVRAQMLTEAERTAAAEQGREQRRRFLTPGSGYQPGNAQMFNNGN